MNLKLIVVALLTIIVVALAWKVSEEKAPQTNVNRTLLFPDLADRINAVTRIGVRSQEHDTVLVREDAAWNVANRDGFPAIPGKVKRTLLQIASLEIVEPKTTRAGQYGRIGVADLDEANADGTMIELKNAAGDSVVALIAGHTRAAGGRAQRYVRRVGEEQSWLVTGELEAPADPIPWVDAQIADIDAAQVRRVSITRVDGDPVVVSKADPSRNFFELENVPEGFEAKSKTTVSSLGAALINLRFNDVASATRVADLEPRSSVVLETFGGLRVRIDLFAIDERTMARFHFEFDPDLAQADGDAAEAAAAGAAEKAEEAGADEAAPEAVKETPEQMAARLESLTARWVYELPDYKMRMIDKRMQDLIKEKSAEPAEAAGSE